MNDPADQKASDEAIKRNANVTPTGFRQALEATARDFAQRTDAQTILAVSTSIPKEPSKITISQTQLLAEAVTLPDVTQDSPTQSAFPDNSDGGLTIDITVCQDQGAGVFVQKTAHFTNGRLVSIT
jgi:hypothetical protein